MVLVFFFCFFQLFFYYCSILERRGENSRKRRAIGKKGLRDGNSTHYALMLMNTLVLSYANVQPNIMVSLRDRADYGRKACFT